MQFRPARSTTDQIFTPKQIFEKSLEYSKHFFACFVDLEKAYDQVSRDKLWKIFQEYGVDGQLLLTIKSFYCRPRFVFWLMASKSNQSRSMWALDSARVRLSPLFFIVSLIESTNAAKLMRCHDWESQNQSSAIC